MSAAKDLLLEVGTEELPPTALLRLGTAFANGIGEGLQAARLSYAEIRMFCSPRRLAVLINGLQAQQTDEQIERRGPALTAAFDDNGCATKAAEGFARSCGVAVGELETLETDNGAWLVFRSEQKGQDTVALVPEILQNALDKLPIPKRMRWGNLDESFVRPVHWIVALFGKDVIDIQMYNLQSGRETFGHRFHHPDAVLIPDASEYETLLESQGRVIADFARRRTTVRGLIEEAAAKTGGTAVIDEDLLDEVTAMVEWPVPVVGTFEQRFLQVPSEVLITTMKTNQKYFHLLDKDGKLMPNFITLSNIDSRDIDKVRQGNERVVRPRLTDAEFFWKQDRRQPLSHRVDSLKSVVFQKKLGSLHDKMRRISKLAGEIASQLGSNPAEALRAGELCKCDLMSDMVYEFPELQGTMGRYYAINDGEPEEVAQAIEEHYQPRFSGDALPESRTGQALAIADKLDTIVGIFAAGQAPTGDKDPFALRRAALGVLRIILEKRLDLNLTALLKHAADLQPESVKAASVINEVKSFLRDRMKGLYLEQDLGSDLFEAVEQSEADHPLDMDRRIHAVNAFQAMPESVSLAAANKRIGNILKKTDTVIPDAIKQDLLSESAERSLFQAMEGLRGQVEQFLQQEDYETTLTTLATLKEPVDRFFDDVMVMDENQDLRNNRLALLKQLNGLFLKVADISRLQHEKRGEVK